MWGQKLGHQVKSLKAQVSDSRAIMALLFSLKRYKNAVAKEENDGYQHLLLLLRCFQKKSFSGSQSLRSPLERLSRGLPFLINV